MTDLTFPKIIKRNAYTVIFGSLGKRRIATDYKQKRKREQPKFKMQRIRRSHQGGKNRVYGTIQALKLRRAFGRRKRVPQFRR